MMRKFAVLTMILGLVLSISSVAFASDDEYYPYSTLSIQTQVEGEVPENWSLNYEIRCGGEIMEQYTASAVNSSFVYPEVPEGFDCEFEVSGPAAIQLSVDGAEPVQTNIDSWTAGGMYEVRNVRVFATYGDVTDPDPDPEDPTDPVDPNLPQHCPDHQGNPGKVESGAKGNDVVLDEGTVFCVKAGNFSTGELTADGQSTLLKYVEDAGIRVGNGNVPDVSYYILYNVVEPDPVCPEDSDRPGMTVPGGESEEDFCYEEVVNPEPVYSLISTQWCVEFDDPAEYEDLWGFEVAIYVEEGSVEYRLAPHGGPDDDSSEQNPDVVNEGSLSEGQTAVFRRDMQPVVAWYELVVNGELVAEWIGSNVDFTQCRPVDEPTDPEDPADPTDPVDPTDPKDPEEDPTDPVDSEDQTDREVPIGIKAGGEPPANKPFNIPLLLGVLLFGFGALGYRFSAALA